MKQILYALSIQVRVIGALLYREFTINSGESKAGYVTAILDPITQILFIAAIFTTIGRGNPLGGSVILFIATGIIPFGLCVKLAGRMMGVISIPNKKLYKYSHVTTFDTVISKLIIESMTLIIASLVIFTGVGIIGFWDYSYDSMLGIMCATIAALTLGFSVGLINIYLATKFAGYTKAWNLISRPLFFISGVFFVASDRFPPEILQYLYFNPVLHIIEWMRSSFYRTWDSSFLDLNYLFSFIICALFLGLLLLKINSKASRQ